MANSMKWYGPQAEAKIQAGVKRNLEAAAIVVENHAKILLSVAGTGGGRGRKRRYGSNPSAPGEPPHKQRGTLRSRVAHEVSGLVARVGTNYLIGRLLELGTRRMKARPWLRRALAECRTQVKNLLGHKVL